jgi:hypothetical protein
MRDAHSERGTVLLQPRWTMSFMRGPMTRSEIRMALEQRRAGRHEGDKMDGQGGPTTSTTPTKRKDQGGKHATSEVRDPEA